jgi:hypothetical protein
MNTYIKTVISIFIVLVSITGCATTENDLVHNGRINIEKVSSREANIVSVNATLNDGQVVVKGEVVRQPPGPGLIPGHIVLEVIGDNGAILETSTIDYHRYSTKSNYEKFHTSLKAIPPSGSTLRITHVD